MVTLMINFFVINICCVDMRGCCKHWLVAVCSTAIHVNAVTLLRKKFSTGAVIDILRSYLENLGTVENIWYTTPLILECFIFCTRR